MKFDLENYKNDNDLGLLWDASNATEFKVNDEEGNNVYEAKCKHLLRQYWLYVDDDQGYMILEESEIESLNEMEYLEKIDN